MKRIFHIGLCTVWMLLVTNAAWAQQSNMRIKPMPPPKKTTTTDNAPPNPRMFFMLILRNKPIPPAIMQEYIGKEYKGKTPEYDLKKMDPDLFKVFKSPNLSVLPAQFYALAVDREADKRIPPTISFTYPQVKIPPPEVDPVQSLAIRNAKNNQTEMGNIQASKIAAPKTKVPAPDADPEAANNLADKIALNSKRKKRGYKNIVFEKTITQELPVASSAPAVNTAQPPTPPPTTNPGFRSDIPVIYDTVPSWRRRRSMQEEMVVTSHHDTIYIVPGDYEDYVETSIKPAPRPSVLKEGTCGCMQMDMMAQDTINFEDYVNYGFKFKNNCKESVYVHSFSFKFMVYESTGYPAKRIRKIDFVKRFDYPAFVKIRPGGAYEYRFADDPFFEYDLVRGKQYKFTFMYNNTSNRSPEAPQHTHLCNDPRDKVIYVQ